MIRVILIGLTVFAFVAGVAHGAVRLDRQRVTVQVVGGISAEPCARVRGCAQAIVELRWAGVTSTHLVRCANPRALHVTVAYHGPGGRFAYVYACRRVYRWRIA